MNAATSVLQHLTRWQLCGLIAVLGLGVMLTLLRLRLLPVAVMRLWFLVTVLFTVMPSSALLYMIDPLRYIGVPRWMTQNVGVFIMCVAFKATCWLNPQIRARLRFDAGHDGKPLTWRTMGTTGNAAMMNHASFWDVFTVIGLTPMSMLLHTRTMMKSTLRSIPIFGGVFDRVGHFPVYFTSTADGDFQVDRPRQAAVQGAVQAHLRAGGNLAIFPEGAINKHPEKLQTFRFGTFATVFEHRMPLYYMLAVGNERTWPPRAPFGGYPADIEVRVGAYPIDYDSQDSKQVAREMQEFLQKRYDEVLAEMNTSRAAGHH